MHTDQARSFHLTGRFLVWLALTLQFIKILLAMVGHIQWAVVWRWSLIEGLMLIASAGILVLLLNRARRGPPSLSQQLQEQLEQFDTLRGEAFYQAFVQKIRTLAGVDAALVGEYQADRQQVDAMVAWPGRSRTRRLTYTVTGTPCEIVLDQGLRIYPRRISQHFSHSGLTKDRKAEGFGGIRLTDKNGNTIGLIALFSNQPIKNSAAIQQLLEQFAPRAATEIIHQRQQRQSVAKSAFDWIDHVPLGTIVLSLELVMIRANAMAGRLLAATTPSEFRTLIPERITKKLREPSSTYEPQTFTIDAGPVSRCSATVIRITTDSTHAPSLLLFVDTTPLPTPFSGLARTETASYSQQLRLRLISLLGHEMRTPLTALQGYTELLSTRKLSDEKYHRYLRQMMESAEILDPLIQLATRQHRRDLLHPLSPPQEIDLFRSLQQAVEVFPQRPDQPRLQLRVSGPQFSEVSLELLDEFFDYLLCFSVSVAPGAEDVPLAFDNDNGSVRLNVSLTTDVQAFVDLLSQPPSTTDDLNIEQIRLLLIADCIQRMGGHSEFRTTDENSGVFSIVWDPLKTVLASSES